MFKFNNCFYDFMKIFCVVFQLFLSNNINPTVCGSSPSFLYILNYTQTQHSKFIYKNTLQHDTSLFYYYSLHEYCSLYKPKYKFFSSSNSEIIFFNITFGSKDHVFQE